jgi:hypothetical protein
LDDLLEIIDALVNEREDTVRVERVPRAERIDWLVRVLSSLHEHDASCCVVEPSDEFVAKSKPDGGLLAMLSTVAEWAQRSGRVSGI